MYKDSSIYKQLEKRWRNDFKKAQKLSLDPRTIDQAKEILRPYRGISEKTKDIQELFVQSNVYTRFKIALGQKDFKLVNELVERYPFLKQFPEYEAMLDYAKKLHEKALEYIKKGDFNVALKTLRILSDFKDN